MTDAWTQLPDGEGITIEAGYRYEIVAMVKNSHDASYIQNLIQSKGLTLNNYQDPASVDSTYPTADSGYRYIAVDVTAPPGTTTTTIPWSVPSPLSVFDSTTMVKAWAEPMQAGLAPAPPVAPSGFPWGPVVGVGAIGGGAALLWWLHRRRRQR